MNNNTILASIEANFTIENMPFDEPCRNRVRAVLAVGDMKFQNKCLEKIAELSKTEGRTVLCVSHNMPTISQLCKRCIVLDKGRVIFDGDTQEAIRVYFGEKTDSTVSADYSESRRFPWLQRSDIRLQSACYIGKEEAVFWDDEKLRFHFSWLYHMPPPPLHPMPELLLLT